MYSTIELFFSIACQNSLPRHQQLSHHAHHTCHPSKLGFQWVSPSSTQLPKLKSSLLLPAPPSASYQVLTLLRALKSLPVPVRATALAQSPPHPVLGPCSSLLVGLPTSCLNFSNLKLQSDLNINDKLLPVFNFKSYNHFWVTSCASKCLRFLSPMLDILSQPGDPRLTLTWP